MSLRFIMWDVAIICQLHNTTQATIPPSTVEPAATMSEAPCIDPVPQREETPPVSESSLGPHIWDTEPIQFFEQLVDRELFASARYFRQCCNEALPTVYSSLDESFRVKGPQKEHNLSSKNWVDSQMFDRALNLLNVPQLLAPIRFEKQVAVAEVSDGRFYLNSISSFKRYEVRVPNTSLVFFLSYSHDLVRPA